MASLAFTARHIDPFTEPSCSNRAFSLLSAELGITNGLIDHIGLARIDANSKKRHRRVKSNHKSDQNKEEGT